MNKSRNIVSTILLVISIIGLILSGIWECFYKLDYSQYSDIECLLNNKKSLYTTIVSIIILFISLGMKASTPKKTKRRGD